MFGCAGVRVPGCSGLSSAVNEVAYLGVAFGLQVTAVGKHDVVGQLVGVQALPLLQGHGFFAFQRLRGFAPAQAGQVGGDVGAEAVAFDLDHQVFAVGAAQHKVGV